MTDLPGHLGKSVIAKRKALDLRDLAGVPTGIRTQVSTHVIVEKQLTREGNEM
jgi:hypothetical protein